MIERACKDWLETFVEYAGVNEAPLYMYYWVGVSTIAGALRRRVLIREIHFSWLANFYIILVAPPGVVSKSTSMTIGMELLKKVPGIHFGPHIVTNEAILDELEASTEAYELEDGSLFPMSAITIESSELGILFDPRNRPLVDALTDLWDAKEVTLRKRTRTQTNNSVQNPWINIIGCTTPAWLGQNFPIELIGQGFTSRCIFVYAEAKRNTIAYPSRETRREVSPLKARLLHDLERIAMLRGEYRLTEDAYEWGTKWYKAHSEALSSHALNSDKFAGYLSRKQGHLHKLAMVIAASRRDELIITAEDMQEALVRLADIEDMMPKVFSHIGQKETTKAIKEMLAYIVRGATFGTSLDELYVHMIRDLPDPREFAAAFEGLKKTGMIQVKVINNGARLFPVPGAALL
jgi:hypothetical protein